MDCSNCGSVRMREFIYCPQCGKKLDHLLPTERLVSLEGNLSERDIIEQYFHSGFEYKTVICFLKKYHDIEISLSTLKRRLSEYGLRRKNVQGVDADYLAGVIRTELNGPGCLGYRAIWHTLRIKFGIVVPRREVEHLIRQLDPDGVSERRRHKLKRRVYTSPGPNHSWHVDGYDKLKPFGFPIHGAIDGYSRRVLWLTVTPTNNDPAVTAKFFYDCVEDLGGCPRLLVTDCGTENGTMASIQCFLRAEDEDDLSGDKSHRYVPSPRNQRIEGWWSYLRKSRTSWWINFFRDMQDRGELISGSDLHQSCLWFCFAELIQDDLDFVKHHWNTHSIRNSRHDTVPGKPDELFFLPEQSNAIDHLQPVQAAKLNDVKEVCSEYIVNSDYHEYFTYVCQSASIPRPKDWSEARFLYHYLLEAAH